MLPRPPGAYAVLASSALVSSAMASSLLLGACGARPARPLVLLPDEPIASVTREAPRADMPLADDDVAHDLAVVLDVLEHDHAAQAFVTRDTFATLRARLGEITRRSHTTQSFCDALGSALTSLIDPGVFVSLERDLSHRCRGDEGTAGGIPYSGARYGEGIASSSPRLHEIRIEPGEIPVTVLGIRAFASARDPGWAGLAQSLLEAESARALVIDLRGARGADASALAPLIVAFSPEPPLSAVHESSTPRADAMRAAARELGVGDEPSSRFVLRALAEDLTAREPLPEIKRDLYVLVDAACEEACELVTRVLATHARAQVGGQVGWRHRLSSGDPGVLVLPHTGVRLVVPLRAVELSAPIARATGDRGSWFDRRGYGGTDAPSEHEDALPAVVAQVRERAVRRARIARLAEAPVPDCASFPRARSLDSMPAEQRGRLDGLYGIEPSIRGATIFVDLPAQQADLLVRTCPGLHVTSAMAIGEPGLEQTLVSVTYDDLLDLTRLLMAEAVSRIELQQPNRDHIDTG